MTSQHTEKPGQVPIQIDQQAYRSPNPTTGAALYALAGLTEDLDLFRDIDGNPENDPVPDDDVEVQLRPDMHFRTRHARERTVKIIVNAEQVKVTRKVLIFEELVKLAFPDAPAGPNVVFTVTFKKAAGPVHQGSLIAGGTVKVKNGTIFNVTRTDKS
jgi:hypothetical protein